MQADLWKKIEELYHAVLAQPPGQRDEFLAQACPDDPQVRAEVQSLLDQKAASFFDGAPMSAVPSLATGARLGNFEIVKLLGRGGMGEVWRARDSRLKREVAIKTLPSHFAADRDRIARFEREARAASALNHPNIVTVYDVGQADGVSFIVSELVEGDTLAHVLERGALPLRKLIEVGTQIADGLAAAHAAGVVHRDLKPGNVMLTSGGRVKILDFGLARQDHVRGPENTAVKISMPGAILGTPGYMSPEQVLGEAANAQSDLFSLGVILYEIASGEPAFGPGSSIEVMHAILKEDPPELPPSSPPALDRIVRRCMEKQPAMRFQSAADLSFALASLSRSQAATTPPARKRLTWSLWTAVTVVCLALGTGGIAWWLRAHSDLPSTLPDATLLRLTEDGGLATDAAISPDGKLVAYASDRGESGNLDIWVQQVDGGGAARITNDPADDYGPTFSPDGTQIAFRSDREGGGIYVAPRLGGEARLLIPQGRRPRYSPDGETLLYSIGAGSVGVGTMFIQRAPGVPPVQIDEGCSGDSESAVWSPDGRGILFLGLCDSDRASGNNNVRLWLSTLDGKRTASPRLPPPFYEIDQWLPDPSRFLVHIGSGNGSSLAALPVSADGTSVAGPAQRLTFGTESVGHASGALDGRIAFSSQHAEPRVWGIPIDGNGHATGAPRQLTSRPAGEYEYLPVLSRDGRNLVFWAQSRLYYRNLVTGKEREISSGIEPYTAAFSPDATRIMFQGTGSAAERVHNSVFEVPVSGGVPKKVWEESGMFQGIDDWSPDAATLLFWRGNNAKILEMDLKSLTKTMFLDDPVYDVWQGHFSHDGRWVTFIGVKNWHSGVYVAPFRKTLVPRSEWIPISDGPWDDKPRFSADGRLIFFTSDRDGFQCIWAQRIGPDMHPAGSPFAVYHSHQRRHSMGNIETQMLQLGVGPGMIVFNRAELTGEIWLRDPAKHAAP